MSNISHTVLTLSCPGTGRAVVKIGDSNLRPGSKELIWFKQTKPTSLIIYSFPLTYIFMKMLHVKHFVTILFLKSQLEYETYFYCYIPHKKVLVTIATKWVRYDYRTQFWVLILAWLPWQLQGTRNYVSLQIIPLLHYLHILRTY